MTKEIRLNAFDMNCVGASVGGPVDSSARPRRRLHRPRVLDRPGANRSSAAGSTASFSPTCSASTTSMAATPTRRFARRVQVPVNDPVLLIPADGRGHRASRLRRHLHPLLRAALPVRPPHVDARPSDQRPGRMEHRHRLSQQRGQRRRAWTRRARHDHRYEIADEYMEVVYKLWEGSWEDDAVVRDRESRIFADPTRSTNRPSTGAYYRVDAIHLCEPSPQRTPVLYQAGASTRGREFAAQHAECVFIYGPSKQVRGAARRRHPRRAAALRPRPADILIFTPDDRDHRPHRGRGAGQARRVPPLHQPPRRRWRCSRAGPASIFRGTRSTSRSAYVKNDAINSAVEAFTSPTRTGPGPCARSPNSSGIGGSGPLVVGSPEQIADELESWVEDDRHRRLQPAYAVTPESFADFVDLVVPELQRRGVYKRDYREGTLREKLYGAGRARLPESHPANAYRHHVAGAADAPAAVGNDNRGVGQGLSQNQSGSQERLS